METRYGYYLTDLPNQGKITYNALLDCLRYYMSSGNLKYTVSGKQYILAGDSNNVTLAREIKVGRGFANRIEYVPLIVIDQENMWLCYRDVSPGEQKVIRGIYLAGVGKRRVVFRADLRPVLFYEFTSEMLEHLRDENTLIRFKQSLLHG